MDIKIDFIGGKSDGKIKEVKNRNDWAAANYVLCDGEIYQRMALTFNRDCETIHFKVTKLKEIDIAADKLKIVK